MRVGLAASVLIHLWIVFLNPRMSSEYATGSGAPAAAAQATMEGGQLVEFVISASARPAPAAATPVQPQRVAPRSSATASVDAPATSTPLGVPGGTGTGAASGAGAPATVPNPGAADPGARLRYRPGPVWTPPPPRVETCAQRVRRQIADRLKAAIDDKNVGVIPSAEAQKPRFEAGIRIPFGRKPPGPAIVVPPPPPPDSFKSVLKPQRDTANPPTFAQDSILCAELDRIEMTQRARPDTLR